MKIGFDLDDTLANHSYNVVKLARFYTKRDFSIHEIATGLLQKELRNEIYKELKNRLYGALSLSAPPMKDSEHVMQKLNKDGHEIFIISRRLNARHFARKWIKKYFPYILEKNIYFVDFDKEKGKVCSKLQLKLFLDNKASVLKHIEKDAKETRPILFDPLQIHKNTSFENVDSWKSFASLFNEEITF